MEEFKQVFRKYTDFSSRSRRREYWMFCLISIIVSMALGILDTFMGTKSTVGFGLLGSLYSLIAFIPSLAVTVRRLHDTGHSAWWYFILLIPLVGVVVFLIFLFRDSTPGDNKYGPNPKGLAVASAASVA